MIKKRSDDGKNWYGKDPILHLIHTLDETVIWRAYMDHHNLSTNTSPSTMQSQLRRGK
jgi:hypothetical protein